MPSPHTIATRLFGAIDWQTEVHGFCRCPGEALHTSRTGPKDCQVHIDGAPTLHCFHASCTSAVAAANKQLRRELGQHAWAIRLPSGKVLNSGDVLQPGGQVLPREVIEAKAVRDGKEKKEALILADTAARAKRWGPAMHETFKWTYQAISTSSPANNLDDGEAMFRSWLLLWPAKATIWMGDIYDSGKPEHASHFRPIADWFAMGPSAGNFTCGSSFKPGSYSRSNANLNGHRFLVVESDTLGKDEVGAVFNYLKTRLQYRLHCVIDTAGKSLHGWFECPPNKVIENRLKAGLTALGCDPKVFTYSQPVRVPGAVRDGKLQRLIWMRN